MRPLLLAIFSLALLLPATFPDHAEAQQRPTKQRRQPRRPQAPSENTASEEEALPLPTLADLDTIVPKLRSENPDEVREAIDLLSVIDRPEVVPPLADLLRAGAPDAITDRALEALGGLAHASTIEVLAEFTHHRRAGARRRAYQALAAIRAPRVHPILVRGLSDSDRSVRSVAALALGDIGARSALDTLFLALERGVVEAAIAIGKLGGAESVNRFSEYLGRQPLSIMLSGYEQYLKRDDIPVRVKTDIVARLGEVSGGMVRRFLSDYARGLSDGDSPFRRHLEETIRRIPEGASTPNPPPSAPPAEGGGQ